jgi:hypothetical protein
VGTSPGSVERTIGPWSGRTARSVIILLIGYIR